MKINRQALLDTLNHVKPGLASKEIIEQTTCFIFQNKKVFTYNDEIAISADTELDISGALPSNELHALISKIKSDEIEVDIIDGEFRVNAKKSKAGIKLTEEITIPIDEIGKPRKWNPLPSTFCRAVEMTSPSTSTDMTKPALTCLFIHEYFIDATDGYKITRFDMAGAKEDEPTFKENILLPCHAAVKLIKYSPIKYALTDGWIHFKCKDNVVFSCRTVNEEVFEVDKFLEMKGKELTLPLRLPEIIEKAEVFAKGQFDVDTQIKITIENQEMILRSEGNTGWFEEKAKIKYSGKKFSFVVHPSHLAEIIKHLNHCEFDNDAMKFVGDDFVHMICLSVSE